MAETVITIPSNRLYLDELRDSYPNLKDFHRDMESLFGTVYYFNRAKEELYNRKYDKEFLDIGLENSTAYIKGWLRKKFGIEPQDYYVTSLESITRGLIQSQKELEKLRQDEYGARSENRKKKLKTLRRRLTIFQKCKSALIKWTKAGRKKRASIPKDILRRRDVKKQFPLLQSGDGGQSYLFEVWLDRQIAWTKASIHQIEESCRQDDKKAADPPGRITFGGGKMAYRLKDTTDADMWDWHEKRDFRRNRTVLFSGRYDSRHKNWVCRYDPGSGVADVTLMDGTVLTLRGVRFPYRGSDLEKVCCHNKEPGWSIGYWLEYNIDKDARPYFLLKASFTVRDDRVNTDISTGIVSVDMNLDNISWSELDSEGHRIDGGMIKFDLAGKTSRQADDILGRACSRVISICVDRKKPLAMEDISLTKKRASLKYGGKKANRGTSCFAHKKMTAFLQGRALRHGVGVMLVNPAYTSFIGKLKYMKRIRQPVHVAASFVIGRRAMGFTEHMPKVYADLIPEGKKRAHHWKKFAHLYPSAKDIKPKTFRHRVGPFNSIKELKELDKSA